MGAAHAAHVCAAPTLKFEPGIHARFVTRSIYTDRDTAISLLKPHEAELRRLGVQHLFLFGSTVRGEARPDSDVDLFFDHEWGKLSLFDVMEIQEVIARILGCKTDVITRGSLHPVLRGRIEMSAVPVF